MDDLTANANSLDGDFKALLQMRKNIKEQTELEEKVID